MVNGQYKLAAVNGWIPPLTRQQDNITAPVTAVSAPALKAFIRRQFVTYR